MNEVLFAFFMVWLFSYSEIRSHIYSDSDNRNARTPGYGVSNYFELMPDKVKNAEQVRKLVNRAPSAKFRIRVLGRGVSVEMNGHGAATQVTVTLFESRGRIVECRRLPAYSGSRSSFITLPRRGIYFLQVASDDFKFVKTISVLHEGVGGWSFDAPQ